MTPRMKKAVTLDDIGSVLNVSRSTVSRAINMSPLVNTETRQKVFETAKTLGFRPNRAARSLVLNKERHIAVVVFSEPEYFWREVQAGVHRASNELYDYRVHVDYISTDIADPQAQVRVLRNLARQGIDGIAISPNDPEVLAGTVDRLIARGIPVVTVSSDIADSRRLCYVGCDYHRAGRIAADLMGRLLGGVGRVAILTFSGAVLPISQRIQGFQEAARCFPGIGLAGPYPLSRTGEETYDFVRGLMRRDHRLTGLFASYGVLEQAGRALRDLKLERKVVLMGYDLSAEIAVLMRQEIVDATICMEPFNQGYFSVKILSDYLVERRLPPTSTIHTKLEIVTRENLLYYENETSTHMMLFDL